MRKGQKWYSMVWSQKGPPRGDGHKIDKEGPVQLMLLKWGAQAVGVAGANVQSWQWGGTFCCYMGVIRVAAGDYAIRDQNKDLKSGFVQGLFLTHYWGSCTGLYTVDTGISKFLPFDSYNLVLKRYLDFLEPHCIGVYVPFISSFKCYPVNEISPICSAEIRCNDHDAR